MEKNIDLKEALMSGVSAEQMIEDFTKQVMGAKETLDKELEQKKKNENLDIVRAKVADALIDYLVALKIFPSVDIKDKMHIKEIAIEAIEEAEKEFTEDLKPMITFLNALDADKIIGKFLKNLD